MISLVSMHMLDFLVGIHLHMYTDKFYHVSNSVNLYKK